MYPILTAAAKGAILEAQTVEFGDDLDTLHRIVDAPVGSDVTDRTLYPIGDDELTWLESIVQYYGLQTSADLWTD